MLSRKPIKFHYCPYCGEIVEEYTEHDLTDCIRRLNKRISDLEEIIHELSE